MMLWQSPDESGESLDVVRLQENLANHGDLLGREIKHTIHHWIDGWHLRPIDRAIAEGINFDGPLEALIRTNVCVVVLDDCGLRRLWSQTIAVSDAKREELCVCR